MFSPESSPVGSHHSFLKSLCGSRWLVAQRMLRMIEYAAGLEPLDLASGPQVRLILPLYR